MSEHSKGPWHVEFEQATHGRREVVCKTPADGIDGFVLAVVLPENYDEDGDPNLTDEDRANARLMAAAPDLLEALQWITRCARISGPVGTTAYIVADEWMDKAKVAIAKAEEEENE